MNREEKMAHRTKMIERNKRTDLPIPYDELVQTLANRATLRVRNGLSRNYGLAIHVVCSGVKSLKSDVGAELNKRGRIKKAIAKIKAEEAKQAVVKQAKLPFACPKGQTTYNNNH